jgi:hypothetical protein
MELSKKTIGNKSEINGVTENVYILQYTVHAGGPKSYWNSGNNM